MRREIVSKARKDSMRVLKKQSLRVLQPMEAEVRPAKTLKKLNMHMRSRTRHFQQQCTKISTNHLQTPAPFLPKIGQITERVHYETEKTGLDTLQEHLHRMLLKNLRKCKENKHVKTLEEDIDRRRLEMKEKEEDNMKSSQKNRLQQLRTKLHQLYADLATEKNKLKIQYSLEQKMEKRYNDFYDKMARRVQKNNTVDTAQNTQLPQQILKQSTKQTPNKQRKGKTLSKFRSAAYAVYFTLFFPKYAKQFRAIRKKYFMKTIIEQKAIQKSIQECYRLFELMKLKVFWKQLYNKNKDEPQQVVSAILSDVDSKDEPFSYNFKLQNINSLLQFVLSSIRSTVKGGKINNFIKNIGYALTNRSYMTDRLFLESELIEININQQMMMNLSPNQQKTLLVNFLFIKLVAFSFMMNNSFISESQAHFIFNKQKTNKFQNLTFTISKQLLLCGIYLIKLCNNLNQKSKPTQSPQGNIENKNVDQLPLPMPQIQLKAKLDFALGGGVQKKRISIQDGIQAFNTEGHGIFVKNINNLSSLLQSLSFNSERQSQFMTLIAEIRDDIHARLIQLKRESYQQLKDLAFEHLNRKAAKQSRQSGFVIPQRNEQQKAQIISYCKYCKSKRPQRPQKQQKYSETAKEAQASNPQHADSSSSGSYLASDSIISIA